MANRTSTHILNASSNLLGFCLVVLTSLKISKYNEETLVDEFTGIVCVLLMASCVFSFLSLRTESESYSLKYEKLADIFFLIALAMVFALTFFIAFTFLF